MNKRWYIVLVVTLFNLLAEYSLRGFANLRLIPILPLGLFLNYFPFFALMEDFIGRYRLRDYQAYVAALFFGLLWMLLGPTVVYLGGINWAALVFVNVVWWTSLQTILGFYIATQIVPRTSWEPLLDRRGRIIMMALFVAATLIFRFAVSFPMLVVYQILLIGGLTAGAWLLFKRMLPAAQQPVPHYSKNRLMDVVSMVTVAFLIYLAGFVPQSQDVSYVTLLNMNALRPLVTGSIVIFFFVLGYRLITRRPIPV